MTASVGVGGVWKAINAVSVGVGGAWKTVTKGWVGVGGVWKEFYAAFTVALAGSISNTTSNTVGTVNAGYRFNSDGTTDRYNVGGSAFTSTTAWGTPTTTGAGADYEIRCTTISGTLSSGSTGVWESLSTARSYVISQSTVGTKTYSGTVEIRRASDSVVVATTTMSLSAERA